MLPYGFTNSDSNFSPNFDSDPNGNDYIYAEPNPDGNSDKHSDPNFESYPNPNPDGSEPVPRLLADGSFQLSTAIERDN